MRAFVGRVRASILAVVFAAACSLPTAESEFPEADADVFETSADAPDTTNDVLDATADVLDAAADATDTTADVLDAAADAPDTTNDVLDAAADTPDPTNDVLDAAADALDTTADVLDAAAEASDTTADVLDATADALDATVEAWAPACTEDDFPGQHEPYYDAACKGNDGCTRLTCLACETSCVLCDGPRCVGVVSDDSCLVGPAYLAEWADEPLGGVPTTVPAATLAIERPGHGGTTVTLAAPDDVPSAATWLDTAGALQTRPLAPPVLRIAERVLVAGEWTMTNYCSGQVASGTQPTQLLNVEVDAQGHASAVLPFSDFDPWSSRLAWIRVFEDAEGLRVFQWFEPSGVLIFGGGGTPVESARVTGPIPADAARPLDAKWGGFDWAAALTR